MKGQAGRRKLPPEKSEQEGHIWGSMQNTAFILGSGLLLSVAFWNSLTWHLQRFWGASGYFWQAQWERLLWKFEGKEWILFIIGAALVPVLLFWAFNGLLLVVDTTGKPNFISRYRIQLGKNEPVDSVKLRQSIRTVLFNQCTISLPVVVFLYPFLKRWGDPCRRELPTLHWFLLELALFTLTEEVLFYYSHRLLHHPIFYKKIHKKHHEWTAPIGVISLYAHPIEYVVSPARCPGTSLSPSQQPAQSHKITVSSKPRESSLGTALGRVDTDLAPSPPQHRLQVLFLLQASNMLPATVGPLAMGSHLSSITVWFSLALIITSISHCGYHLPFLPSPEFHDYHHLKFNQCYGVLGVLDHLHGTDTVFKQTKAYERHVLLLGFTPLSESIPDSPKKME